MSNAGHKQAFAFEGPALYRIVVQGRVDETMSDRLGGMRVETTREGDQGRLVTTLVGHLRDQAELNGVLNTVYSLHLTVLSVQCVDGLRDDTEK
jgi:hypothetical protein